MGIEKDQVVKCIPINGNDRYVFMLHFPSDRHPEKILGAAEGFQRSIDQWWQSGEKFGVFIVWGDVKVSVERVEDASKN